MNHNNVAVKTFTSVNYMCLTASYLLFSSLFIFKAISIMNFILLPKSFHGLKFLLTSKLFVITGTGFVTLGGGAPEKTSSVSYAT